MYIPDIIMPVLSGNVNNSSISASGSSQTLLSGNFHRVGASLFNHSSDALFVRMGDDAAASETDFTVKLSSGSYYELPKPVYTGEVRGVWDGSAGGIVLITEYTRP